MGQQDGQRPLVGQRHARHHLVLGILSWLPSFAGHASLDLPVATRKTKCEKQITKLVLSLFVYLLILHVFLYRRKHIRYVLQDIMSHQTSDICDSIFYLCLISFTIPTYSTIRRLPIHIIILPYYHISLSSFSIFAYNILRQ